jgi:hypothetical protein
MFYSMTPPSCRSPTPRKLRSSVANTRARRRRSQSRRRRSRVLRTGKRTNRTSSRYRRRREPLVDLDNEADRPSRPKDATRASGRSAVAPPDRTRIEVSVPVLTSQSGSARRVSRRRTSANRGSRPSPGPRTADPTVHRGCKFRRAGHQRLRWVLDLRWAIRFHDGSIGGCFVCSRLAKNWRVSKTSPIPVSLGEGHSALPEPTTAKASSSRCSRSRSSRTMTLRDRVGGW